MNCPRCTWRQNTLACLDHNGISRSKVKLVIKRYNADLGLSSEAVKEALGLKIFQQLPRDYEGVQKALMEKESLSPTGTEVGKGFAELAEKLSGRKHEYQKPSLFGGFSQCSNCSKLPRTRSAS